jgi:hypothetical protein
VLAQTGMGKLVPCHFALLPNKDRDSYQRLATCIKDHLKSIPSVLVNSIHMDFEKGLMSAFSSTFPGVGISGCEFHWKSCLWKRIAADGLMMVYNNSIKMKQLVRYIWSLAYLPNTEIIRAWESILVKVKDVLYDMEENIFNNTDENFSKELESFIKYMDSTWIGERNPRTMLWKKPAYPHEQWSKYEELLGGESRTNNITEGYNNGFSIFLPSRATEWTLIERFKVEESMAKTTLHQLLLATTNLM